MNRFVVLAIAGCIASAALSAPANAAPILPDPTIGVRGDGGGSPPVTDGSAQLLQPCGTVAATSSGLSGIESFFCAAYQFTGEEGFGGTINSFDLAFWDSTGAATPVICLDGCGSLNFVPSEQSDFSVVTRVNDFVIQLARYCPEGCSDPAITPGHFLLFVEQAEYNGGYVSIQAVNGSSAFQTDLATPGRSISPVPEPASLVLLGTGLVGMVARRRLRRKGER